MITQRRPGPVTAAEFRYPYRGQFLVTCTACPSWQQIAGHANLVALAVNRHVSDPAHQAHITSTEKDIT